MSHVTVLKFGLTKMVPGYDPVCDWFLSCMNTTTETTLNRGISELQKVQGAVVPFNRKCCQ